LYFRWGRFLYYILKVKLGTSTLTTFSLYTIITKQKRILSKMDWDELEVFRPSARVVEKCIRKAERFRPCLCDYTSDEDAIIDLYIMNTSEREFRLVDSENIVSLGPFADQQLGLWILAPPPVLDPKTTIFARAYSGKISTTDPGICNYDVTFTVTVAYVDEIKNTETITPFFRFEVGSLRESPEGGCSELQPFDPLAVTNINSNFPVVNIYNLTPQSGIDTRPQSRQDIFALEGDLRWRNTAFFIIS